MPSCTFTIKSKYTFLKADKRTVFAIIGCLLMSLYFNKPKINDSISLTLTPTISLARLSCFLC